MPILDSILRDGNIRIIPQAALENWLESTIGPEIRRRVAEHPSTDARLFERSFPSLTGSGLPLCVPSIERVLRSGF
jgi:hypothetical protein